MTPRQFFGDLCPVCAVETVKPRISAATGVIGTLVATSVLGFEAVRDCLCKDCREVYETTRPAMLSMMSELDSKAAS